MSSDSLLRAVRRQLALGRLLPLGPPADSSWIAERAAVSVLRHLARELPGIRVDALRLGPDPDAASAGRWEPGPPDGGTGGRAAAPMGAVTGGPLRIEASFAATAAQPLPARAQQLRTVLNRGAADRLGLDVARVDLVVTGLLEEGEDAGPESAHDGRGGAPVSGPDGHRPPVLTSGGSGTPPGRGADGTVRRGSLTAAVTAGVLGVPGVMRPEERADGTGADVSVSDTRQPPARHVGLRLVVDGHRRVPEVVRQARAAAVRRAGPGAPGPLSVSVVVTEAVTTDAVAPGRPGARSGPG
ncbi:hypothetical protein GCM10009716_28850 [Streptomyces sodiiphilus]|uniref:Nucleopolyhedrovirus P10 family protein n=1 Tax=Streptomyces sodiiphilus TaxID=226217 RepID=A0ABN2PCG1_9ACTN